MSEVDRPEIVVRPCRPPDVAVLTALEPPGSALAQTFFARQQAGGVTFLVGWIGEMPAGTGVLVLSGLTTGRPLNGESSSTESFSTESLNIESSNIESLNGGSPAKRPGDAARSELKNLHVHEQFRDVGVGSALVRGAEAIAAAAGSTSLVIGVGVDNPRARALYERLGYAGTCTVTSTTYCYVDDAGVEHVVTEQSEDLEKLL